VRVLALTPDIVGRFKREKSCGKVGFDKGHGTSIFQKLHHGTIFGIWLSCVLGEADGAVKTLDLNRVLERDGDSGKRTLQVNLVLGPLLSLGKQNLSGTVGLVMCLERYFGVGTQDVDGVGDALVDILDEVLNGLTKNGALLCGEGRVVMLWQRRDLRRSLVLLALAVWRLA
jgi:hypothetical protein